MKRSQRGNLRLVSNSPSETVIPLFGYEHTQIQHLITDPKSVFNTIERGITVLSNGKDVRLPEGCRIALLPRGAEVSRPSVSAWNIATFVLNNRDATNSGILEADFSDLSWPDLDLRILQTSVSPEAATNVLGAALLYIATTDLKPRPSLKLV